jgi:hypothetical protein
MKRLPVVLPLAAATLLAIAKPACAAPIVRQISEAQAQGLTGGGAQIFRLARFRHQPGLYPHRGSDSATSGWMTPVGSPWISTATSVAEAIPAVATGPEPASSTCGE